VPSIKDLASQAYARQPLRFLLVGAFNTVSGYLIFVLLYYLFSPFVHYLVILGACAVINISIAFILHKTIVFRTRGNYLREYLRFYVVYAVPTVSSAALLTFAIEVLRMNVYVAQAVITLAMTVVSYFGHKHFSFRSTASGGGA
jgi:putative flippase GtrA